MKNWTKTRDEFQGNLKKHQKRSLDYCAVTFVNLPIKIGKSQGQNFHYKIDHF